VGDWLQFEEGSRPYRVAGLDALCAIPTLDGFTQPLFEKIR
jgi:hypothetical protein